MGYVQSTTFVTGLLERNRLGFHGMNVAAPGIEVLWSGLCTTANLNSIEVLLVWSVKTPLPPILEGRIRSDYVEHCW